MNAGRDFKEEHDMGADFPLRLAAMVVATAWLASLTVGYQVDLWKKISNSRKAALFDLQSLQDLERQAISTRQELLVNRIRLYLALGGSWSRTLENPTSPAEEQT